MFNLTKETFFSTSLDYNSSDLTFLYLGVNINL